MALSCLIRYLRWRVIEHLQMGSMLLGHGHIVKYLDKAKVMKYVALEPNTCMHPEIRLAANAGGYNEVDRTFVHNPFLRR